MALRTSFLFCLLGSGLAAAQPVTLPPLDAKETKKLDANEVVIRETKPTDGKGIGVESMALIDAPSLEVWPVLRDCAQFSKFMPRTKASAMNVEDGVPLCHVELDLPFPLTNLWSDTRSVMREEPPGHFHRAWTMVRGTYWRNDGAWTLVPWGADGKKTLVVYSIDSNPKLLVPDALLRAGQVGTLPEVFKAIRGRVADVRAVAAKEAAKTQAESAARDASAKKQTEASTLLEGTRPPPANTATGRP